MIHLKRLFYGALFVVSVILLVQSVTALLVVIGLAFAYALGFIFIEFYEAEKELKELTKRNG